MADTVGMPDALPAPREMPPVEVVHARGARAMQGAESRFRAVQDASPDACIILEAIVDGSGEMCDALITYANASAFRLMKRPEDTLVGRHLDEAFPGAISSGRLALYVEVFRTGLTRELVFHSAEVDRWLRIIVCKVPDGVCIIGTDMSEQKAAEAVLRRSYADLERLVAERTRDLEAARHAAEAANTAKSDFLSRASHELRTPLNSVIGFSTILLKNRAGTLGPDELAFVDRISRNGRHLLALVNDLLDLSKIEAGKMELELSPVSLYDLAHDVRSTLEGPAADRRLLLTVDLPDDGLIAPDLTIVTDEQRLRQVLINLVGNAIKYTESGAVIVRVITTASGCPVRIDVVDTGLGIAPHRVEAMFEPFVIGDRAGVDGESTGLGLAISRSLCDALGYRLSATSSVGGGSVFTIHLDADEEQALPTSGTAGSRTLGQFTPRHVMLMR